MRSSTLFRNDHWSWFIVKNLIKCWLLISHIFFCPHLCIDLRKRGASLGAQTVTNPPAMWETWVWSLCWEDPLKEGMATPSSVLVWRILMDRGAWKATVHGAAKQHNMWNKEIKTSHTEERVLSLGHNNTSTGVPLTSIKNEEWKRWNPQL